MTEPAWLADPTGRHQTRYWDGHEWTGHVADNGVAGFDPPTMPPPSAIVQTPFAAPTPPGMESQHQSGSRKWWLVAVPIVVIGLIAAVVALRDSNRSTSSAGAGGSSGGGRGIRVDFTDSSGYQYVVVHTGAVQLRRTIENASPGFAVVHVTGGKVSVANANSGRNAPMPRVRLLAYITVPDCDTETSIIGPVETKVSLRASCVLQIGSDWSHDADVANGMGGLDSLLGSELEPGQTAVAAVDDSWYEADAESTVPDTVQVNGPVAWGIEVEDANTDLTGSATQCVIGLVGGDTSIVQQLTDAVSQLERGSSFQPYTCQVVPG